MIERWISITGGAGLRFLASNDTLTTDNSDTLAYINVGLHVTTACQTAKIEKNTHCIPGKTELVCRGVVDHSGLRSECIKIFRGTFSERRGGEFVFIAQHKKRTKIVATRHAFWVQNVHRMLCGRGSAQKPAGGAHSAPQAL